MAVVSGELAWSTLLAGIESRYPNGDVPNWRSRHGGTPDRSQPPIGSFAALQLHLIRPDFDALDAAYEGLLAWCDWWVADKGGGPRREGITPGLLAWGSDTALVPGPGRVPPWEEGAGGHRRTAWKGAGMFLADRRRTGMCRENFDARTGEGCGRRFQSWGPLLALSALEEPPHAIRSFRPLFGRE